MVQRAKRVEHVILIIKSKDFKAIVVFGDALLVFNVPPAAENPVETQERSIALKLSRHNLLEASHRSISNKDLYLFWEL